MKQEIKLLTTDFLSRYFIEPVCAKLLDSDPTLKLSLTEATIDSEPEVHVYLLTYEHLFEDFIHEVILETEMSLWANGRYLEKYGVPRKLDDLLSHTMIRPLRGAVELAFGVETFKTLKTYVPYYYKKDCIHTDGILSLVNLAESGAGITAALHHNVSKFGLRLERIPYLEDQNEACYRKYVVGYHKKYKDDPVVKSLVKEIKSLVLNKQ